MTENHSDSEIGNLLFFTQVLTQYKFYNNKHHY